MMYGKKDIKKNIFLSNVYFNPFLLFEIKHPYFEELGCHSDSGANIPRGNVHQYNNSSYTGIALLQVSKSHPDFCSQAHVQQHTLKRGCSFPHVVSLQRNATALSLQILRKYREWWRPADATGIGLGMSNAKGSLAVQ